MTLVDTKEGIEMIVDSQAHCVIEYSPELQCIIQTWKGFAGSKNFRASIEKTIEFARANPVRSVISDTREQNLVGMEDIKWLTEVGNPQLIEVGIQKLAFISPKDQLTRLGESDYAFRSKQQFIIQWFSDPEQAKAWIKKKP